MSGSGEDRQAKGGGDAGESDRRRSILRAAINVFAKKGYHGCRIADVAREADVAYGLVYHYFKNKEELLQSVFAEGFGRFTKLVAQIAEGEGTVAEKVEQITGSAIEAFRQDPLAVKVLILEIARSPAFREEQKRSAFEETLRVTARMLENGQRRGELRAGIDPLVAAYVLFGAIELALTAFVLGTLDANDEQHAADARRSVTEIFLHGVAPGPAAPAKPIADPNKDAEGSAWKNRKSSTKSRVAKQS